MHQIWTTANRTRKTFFNKYMSWLEEEIKWPVCNSLNLVEIFKETIDLEEDSSLSISVNSANPSTSRETKDQKKRRSGGLSDYSKEELSFALVANLKKNKRMELAEVIVHLMKNPDQAPGVKAYLTPRKTGKIQADQALALTNSLNLSKWQYLVLRGFMSDAESSAKLPSYHKLLESKKNCYPDPTDIEISEQGAKVKLQPFLNLTCKRILQVVGAIDVSEGELKMTSK
ncbi:hypothetical protein ACJJTC_013064 [Scirpophaga incertulas]